MSEIAITKKQIPTMSELVIERVRELEDEIVEFPQVKMDTQHIFHGGMYARTILIPAGTLLTGTLIKIATMVIIYGDVIFYVGEQAFDMKGYNILPASAMRKQVLLTRSDTYVTMVFPSKAKTVKEAEEQFTDESYLLGAHRDGNINHVIVTEE